MRDEETAWDTKGPAYTFRLRGGLDAQGNLVAFDYDAQSADYNHVGYSEGVLRIVRDRHTFFGARPYHNMCSSWPCRVHPGVLYFLDGGGHATSRI